MAIGCFPGSFNPPTVAHLTIAEAAVRQCALDRLDLVLSVVALGKEDDPDLVALDARVEALERLAASRPWLAVVTTDARLLADIAQGYDVLVLGADKWNQVIDPAWYGSKHARDEAVARLPLLAVAPRPPHPMPPPGTERVVHLDTDPSHHEVSATAVRNGRLDWLAPDAPSHPWHADDTADRQSPGGERP